MNPAIIEKKAFAIVGMKYEGTNSNDEILELWPRFMQNIHKVGNRVNSSEFFGYDTWTEEINETGAFIYYVATEVEDETQVPEGMDCIQIPANKYAVFTLENKDVHNAVQQVFKKWLPESGYKLKGNYDFEYYDENFNPEDENAKIYFYIPVE